MRKLKIGFVLDDGLDKPDGVQQNILTLGGWLSKHGHEVRYLVGQTKKNDLSGIIELSKNLKVSFNGNRLSIPLVSSSRKISSVLKAEKFDVIHVQVPYSPLMAARLVNKLDEQTALIGTFHILPTGNLSFWGTKVLGKFLAANLKNFDRQLAVSEPAKLFAKQSFNINCDVLPNPVDILKYKNPNKLKKNSDIIKIIFVGRLVSRKGCQYLLQAIDHMMNNYPPKTKFHIDICGDGSMKAKLASYTSSHGFSKLVSFRGFISEDQKINLLRQADISIFPSTAGESFGIVLVESMAANSSVVIGGDNPGYQSVLGTIPESLVNPKQTEIFSKKICKLIDDSSYREKIYRAQQELVGQFDVNVVGQNLLNIYNDCIYRKKSR